MRGRLKATVRTTTPPVGQDGKAGVVGASRTTSTAGPRQMLLRPWTGACSRITAHVSRRTHHESRRETESMLHPNKWEDLFPAGNVGHHGVPTRLGRYPPGGADQGECSAITTEEAVRREDRPYRRRQRGLRGAITRHRRGTDCEGSRRTARALRDSGIGLSTYPAGIDLTPSPSRSRSLRRRPGSAATNSSSAAPHVHD